MARKVLLIGGGHAHIEVIRRWAIDAPKNASLHVVDPNAHPIYSGMVPGYIAGQYDRSSLAIDLKELCRRAQASYTQTAVCAIDAAKHGVSLLEHPDMNYDLASIDIGSSVAGKEITGVSQFALATRPIESFLTRVDNVVRQASKSVDSFAPVHVVGGGAGGVEVAFCLDARFRKENARHASVELIISDRQLLEASAASTVAAAEKYAADRGIRVHRTARVVAVGERSVKLDCGQQLDSSGVIWVAGPAAHSLASASRLPMDDRGFFRIDSTLRVEGQADLFAVGDCASLPGMKKAGVYAVRSAPLIDANLRARLANTSLHEYKPQRDFLSLLNLGNGEAIGTKWGLTIRGTRVMWLKDRIDRSFMEKYR